MGRAFEFRKARKMKRWSAMAKTFTRIGKDIVMNGNSSMMTDKDRTFFEEYKPKTSRINMKDCTKNSSNPERVYGE